jgi:hypothetical protein
MRVLFRHVVIDKPTSSRANSKEAFLVCRHYDPPAGYVPAMDTLSYGAFVPRPLPPPPPSRPADAGAGGASASEMPADAAASGGGGAAGAGGFMPTGAMAGIVPFIAIGDLSGHAGAVVSGSGVARAVAATIDAASALPVPPAVAAKLARFAV